MQATTGPALGMRIQNTCAIVVGLTIGLATSWRLALVILGTVPLMALSGVMMRRLMTCES